MPVRRIRVVPPSPLRLPSRVGGLTEGDRETWVRRLTHVDGEPVVLTARRDGPAVVLESDAATARAADAGLERARYWTGADEDLTAFLTRHADDPRIGRSVREAPWVRPFRTPMPFDALLGAICEQLITDERAQDIKRRIARHHGRRAHDLLDLPGAEDVAALAPAQLERCGLAAARARTLVRVAREVAAGRIDLLDPERREAGWRRLRAIDGIGPWTVSVLALHGQGQWDALPAGDHAYRTVVAAALGRRPGAKADEAEVVAFLAPYAGWRGLAGWHLLRTARVAARRPPARSRR